MAKFAWDKGFAQDGGTFYEFTRTDIARQEIQSDNSVKRIGYYVELKFSGMYIAVGYYAGMNETVSIEDVKFWSLDNNEKIIEESALSLNRVNPRYFSEIISQLMTIFGGIENENEA